MSTFTRACENVVFCGSLTFFGRLYYLLFTYDIVIEAFVKRLSGDLPKRWQAGVAGGSKITI